MTYMQTHTPGDLDHTLCVRVLVIILFLPYNHRVRIVKKQYLYHRLLCLIQVTTQSLWPFAVGFLYFLLHIIMAYSVLPRDVFVCGMHAFLFYLL